MTVNSIVTAVHLSKKASGSNQHKNCCTYRILKTVHSCCTYRHGIIFTTFEFSCTYLQTQFKRRNLTEVCLIVRILSTRLVIIFWNFTVFSYSSYLSLVKQNLIYSMTNLAYKLP